jgi:hypothetical protein
VGYDALNLQPRLFEVEVALNAAHDLVVYQALAAGA